MKILFATSNAGKVNEIKNAVDSSRIEIIPQDFSPVEETATTFVENALLKARHAAEKSVLPVLADDSGLVVDALHGQPGIFSSRYAGDECNPKKNIEKLLRELELKKVPDEKRNAYFYCVLVYLKYADDPTPIICEGIWHGKILFAPQGEESFGYDPIFYVPEKNCSAAELPLTIKNQLSHRGQAIQQWMKKINESTFR